MRLPWFTRFIDRGVTSTYIEAGVRFGEALSYTDFGRISDWGYILKRWGKWEKIYAERGFRTISLGDFVECGGWGEPLQEVGVKRDPNEAPIYYAQLYRQEYGDEQHIITEEMKITPVPDLMKRGYE